MQDGFSRQRSLVPTTGTLPASELCHLIGAPVPASGGVEPMWFSNLQAINGEIPDILFEMLPSPLTLRQGAKNAGSQFLYSYATGESDHMLYFASFNLSFAVGGITALDRSIYLEKRGDKFPIFRPGQFRRQG